VNYFHGTTAGWLAGRLAGWRSISPVGSAGDAPMFQIGCWLKQKLRARLASCMATALLPVTTEPL